MSRDGAVLKKGRQTRHRCTIAFTDLQVKHFGFRAVANAVEYSNRHAVFTRGHIGMPGFRVTNHSAITEIYGVFQLVSRRAG